MVSGLGCLGRARCRVIFLLWQIFCVILTQSLRLCLHCVPSNLEEEGCSALNSSCPRMLNPRYPLATADSSVSSTPEVCSAGKGAERKQCIVGDQWPHWAGKDAPGMASFLPFWVCPMWAGHRTCLGITYPRHAGIVCGHTPSLSVPQFSLCEMGLRAVLYLTGELCWLMCFWLEGAQIGLEYSQINTSSKERLTLTEWNISFKTGFWQKNWVLTAQDQFVPWKMFIFHQKTVHSKTKISNPCLAEVWNILYRNQMILISKWYYGVFSLLSGANSASEMYLIQCNGATGHPRCTAFPQHPHPSISRSSKADPTHLCEVLQTPGWAALWKYWVLF